MISGGGSGIPSVTAVIAEPWPLGEPQRRQAAEIAATATDQARFYLGHVDGTTIAQRRELLAYWLDIATKAAALAGPWRAP